MIVSLLSAQINYVLCEQPLYVSVPAHWEESVALFLSTCFSCPLCL